MADHGKETKHTMKKSWEMILRRRQLIMKLMKSTRRAEVGSFGHAKDIR